MLMKQTINRDADGNYVPQGAAIFNLLQTLLEQSSYPWDGMDSRLSTIQNLLTKCCKLNGPCMFPIT